MGVVDDPEVVEALRGSASLVVWEAVAALETLDREAAARAKSNLVLYMATPSPTEKRLFSTLLSLVEAVLKLEGSPCLARRLVDHAMQGLETAARMVGAELLDYVERLREAAERACTRTPSQPRRLAR